MTSRSTEGHKKVVCKQCKVKNVKKREFPIFENWLDRKKKDFDF